MANDYQPKFKPGQAIPQVAAGTITAGLMVTVAGVVAGADSITWFGVASQDAVSGQDFGVYTGGVQYLTAAGAISQGAIVKCAASGQVTTATVGTDSQAALVGIAVTAASGAGVQFPVQMYR
jgi:hypothetical protein